MAGLRTGGRLIADQGGEATYLGYSMGARFCLHVALTNPELVARPRAARRHRRHRGPDGARAAPPAGPGHRRAHRARRPRARSSTTGWPSRSSPASRRSERSARSASRTPSTGLQSSLEQAGTGAQDPSWHELHRLDMPVLVLAGADDAKFAALAERLADEIGANATARPRRGRRPRRPPRATRPLPAVVQPWLADHGPGSHGHVATASHGSMADRSRELAQALSQRPPARRVPLTSWTRPVAARTGMRAGPAAPSRTWSDRLAGEHDADEGGGRRRVGRSRRRRSGCSRTRRRAWRRRASGCGRRRCGRRACACPTRCRRGCRAGC